jgi:hypothetical protein
MQPNDKSGRVRPESRVIHPRQPPVPPPVPRPDDKARGYETEQIRPGTPGRGYETR